MGGKVNPGLENVNYLVNTLQPKEVLNTHDEQKTYKGLVMKIAKCHYPDLTQITFPQSNFTNLLDYSYYTI